MTILSFKTGAGGERIALSDGSLFSFRNCYLPEGFNPQLTNPEAVGSEISVAEEACFRHASACFRAEKTALRLIARAEQCSAGLSRKLEKRGYERVCVNAVISRLLDLRLLDDCRFAQLWLESRLRLARSPRRLLIALCARGVDRGDADAAIKAVLDDDAEFSLLARFVKKQARKIRNIGDDTRSLKYMLKSEGFSLTAIERFLNEEDQY